MKVIIDRHDFTIIWDGVYYLALSDYPRISPWELCRLTQFAAYEKANGRTTQIECSEPKLSEAVEYALRHPDKYAGAKVPPKITECTACRQGGCLTEFLCHTASLENAKRILSCRGLLSARLATGKSYSELCADSRNAAHDPEDFFDYVMFSWGNCQAGDRLVTERYLGRDQTARDLSADGALTLGVRFYWRYDVLAADNNAVFDGYHPLKIKDGLPIDARLYAVAAPEKYRGVLEPLLWDGIREKAVFADSAGCDLFGWADKIYRAVI